MIRETTASSSSTEQIDLGSTASLIGAASVPFSYESGEAVLESLEAECGQIARSVHESAHAELQTAEVAAELSVRRLGESEADFAEASGNARTMPCGSYVKVLLWSLSSTACFAAEFVLTWTALCFVLNIPRMTVLGVLLGLAPPSGLAVLEIFLARLFEEPWQRLRTSAPSRQRLAASIAMGVLLTALALGNGITIVHLAKAREEAVKIQRDLQKDDADQSAPSAGDQTAIDRAVLWISVCVCVDGSVFLLLALAQSTLLRDRARLDRRLAVARNARLALETEHAAIVARAKNAAEAWRTVDERAALAADRYRAHCHYLIAEKHAARSKGTVEELVDRAIRLRLCA